MVSRQQFLEQRNEEKCHKIDVFCCRVSHGRFYIFFGHSNFSLENWQTTFVLGWDKIHWWRPRRNMLHVVGLKGLEHPVKAAYQAMKVRRTQQTGESLHPKNRCNGIHNTQRTRRSVTDFYPKSKISCRFCALRSRNHVIRLHVSKNKAEADGSLVKNLESSTSFRSVKSVRNALGSDAMSQIGSFHHSARYLIPITHLKTPRKHFIPSDSFIPIWI